MYRQGDILLIPVRSIPDGATSVQRENGRVVLAYGEATGHVHAIADPEAELLAVSEQADRWLRVRTQVAQLSHQEHGTITLPAGNYIVRRQREYQPEAVRYVAD